MTARAKTKIKAAKKEEKSFQKRFAAKIKKISRAARIGIIVESGVLTKKLNLTSRYGG